MAEVFSRNSSCEVIRYARNVPLGVLEKCCIFLERLKIEYGRSDLTFPEACSSCFFPQKFCIWNHLICQKFSSRGSEEVLLLEGIEFHDDCTGFWLAETYLFIYFSRPIASKWLEMFPYGNVVIFLGNAYSKMIAVVNLLLFVAYLTSSLYLLHVKSPDCSQKFF